MVFQQQITITKVINRSIESKKRMSAQYWQQAINLSDFKKLEVENFIHGRPVSMLDEEGRLVVPRVITVEDFLEFIQQPDNKQLFSDMDMAKSFYEFMSKLTAKILELNTILDSAFRLQNEIIIELQDELKPLDEVDEVMAIKEQEIEDLNEKIRLIEENISFLKVQKTLTEDANVVFTEMFVDFQKRLFDRMNIPFDKNNVLEKIKEIIEPKEIIPEKKIEEVSEEEIEIQEPVKKPSFTEQMAKLREYPNKETKKAKK